MESAVIEKPKFDILNYPHDLDENLRFRARLLKICETDEVLQKTVKELCSKDIILWIDLFCWTKDPRKVPDVLPFILYEEYQSDYVLEIETAIDEQHDELTDKSRDMGVSWMILYVFMHKWLFEHGSDFRVGSRKEDFVDKINDIDTLLEKVRFNLTKQPIWMLPRGFKPLDHAGYMRIFNPENKNTIIGESANPHFGSGGRRKAVLLDEFAKWEPKVAEAAWTATADVTKCRLPISTPVGSGNKFAQLSEGSKEKIKKISLHWTLHPEKSKGAYFIRKGDGMKVLLEVSQDAFKAWKDGKNPRSPWYDAEAERRSVADLAQEVDIDYLKSGHPFFDMEALKRQRAWQCMEVKKAPHEDIPYGYFITGKLVEVENKAEFRSLKDGELRVFEFPKEGYQYVVSGDTSEGLEKGDESFLIVRDKSTRNVVAALNGLIKPDSFALKLAMTALFYNKAIVAPENNFHGYSVCEDLKKVDCNLYWTERINEVGEVKRVKAGWSTTPTSRPEMLDQAEEEIRKDAVELRDEILIKQCTTFVKNVRTGKPEADGAYLDDGVMAFGIGGDVIKKKPYKAPVKRDGKRRAMRYELAHRKNAGISFSGRR